MNKPRRAGVGRQIDERLGGGRFAAKAMRKAFPDHWSFLLGEIALYSFVIVLLTGVFLTLFFKPGATEVTYNGSYIPLRGIRMSEAYASTLNLSFDVRGGLLMRQMHHWATLLFLSAIAAHLLRNFFTGAFRKPRDTNWVIGIVLFVLALLNGLFGYSLPDDLLSGTGLRTMEGVVLSIPVIGTYLMMFMFGGEFPGEIFIPRLFALHVLLIPGVLLALIPLHALVLTWRQTHTQFPGRGSTERVVRGYPLYPVFAAKTAAYFLWVVAVTALMATFLQINPVWLFGPYDPGAISAGSQPDWYMGFLEGALRIMPAWEINAWGHTLTLSVFIPALLVPAAFFIGLAMYPALERWVTGDHQIHHLLDRPRDVPARTGIGFAGITFFGVLWAEGGNDILAKTFGLSLFSVTWFFRIMVFLGPVIAYLVAYQICLGLQRRERELLEHGVETGIIEMRPDGAFVETVRPATDEEVASIVEARPPVAVPIGGPEREGVEHPARRRPLAKVRIALNQHFTADLGPSRPDGREQVSPGETEGPNPVER